QNRTAHPSSSTSSLSLSKKKKKKPSSRLAARRPVALGDAAGATSKATVGLGSEESPGLLAPALRTRLPESRPERLAASNTAAVAASTSSSCGCGLLLHPRPRPPAAAVVLARPAPHSASKMPQVMVVARNFMDMVAALPASKLDMLYDSAFICEAVLRWLPPLAKKYALQMLYVLAPVTCAAMEEWVLNEYAAKHRVAIDKLLQLRVFVEVRDRRKDVSYKMNQKFQGNMQKYLVDGGSLPREPMPLSVTGRLTTSSDLEAYALNQWECFLLQLINSSQVEKGTNFSSSMMKTFQRGLLSSRDGEAPKLTENGFQFLLMETNSQLWYIMREYISSAEERGVDPTELISFLLELSFHKLGAAYSLNTLTDVQRIAIRDLAELGLVKLQQV
ncbi:unnamed protein product, partial [Urochloa humidicola]